MDNNGLLNEFDGKSVYKVSSVDDYELKIEFTDGSMITVSPKGPEGSKIRTEVTCTISRTL